MDFSTLNNKNSKNDGDFCPHRFLSSYPFDSISHLISIFYSEITNTAGNHAVFMI